MRAIGLYFCKGEDEEELTFSAGDVIERVKPSTENGWFTGYLNGKKGLFPGNYTRFESDPLSDSKTSLNEEEAKIADNLPASRIQSIYRDKFAGTLYNSQDSLVKAKKMELSSTESLKSNQSGKIKPPVPTRPSSTVSVPTNLKPKVPPPIPSRLPEQYDPLLDTKNKAPPIPNREPLDPFQEMKYGNNLQYKQSNSSSQSLNITKLTNSQTQLNNNQRIPHHQAQLYEDLFRKHDRFNRNLLSPTLVKSIWSKSQLDPQRLGNIYNLLIVNEGLTMNEFVIGNRVNRNVFD